ncbi:MAG: glycosyl hydrolase [Bacteroidia bacterium 43-41]|nr:MAG: glycosyl hydrolase [Bacteroidia bacterium 43-41]
MAKRIVSFLFVFCLVLLSCTEQDKKRILFDGENMTGWSTEGSVAALDSVIRMEDTGKITLKNGMFTNFELLVTARTVDNGKGEIRFHTDKNGDGGYAVALNNDLENSQWWTKTGSLLSVRNLTKSIVKRNEWFPIRIRVEGKKIEVAVNDELLVEYIEPAHPYRTPENRLQILSNGTFSLRSTEGAIEVKSIEVTPLKIDKTLIDSQLAEAIDESSDDIIKLHQANFPVLDYHVHLKEDLTLDLAKSQSRRYGINYALAPNCGIGFPIQDDAQVLGYFNGMQGQPFVQAMQGEGREWPVTFSKEVRDLFDYVFTDAMTFTDRKGNRTRLWMPDEVFIDDEQEYMDLIVEKIVMVMDEPMDVYVNPSFLPVAMNDRYDMLWTDERQNKVIDAMVRTGKVLEINNRYEIPHKSFIQKAKAAGLKFTFGTNNSNSDFGKLEYCIRMMKECGITAQDMYKPKMTE